MDKLDRFSIFAIIVLLLSSLALMTNHMGEARSDRDDKKRGASDTTDVLSEIEDEVKAIKDLIEGGNLSKAEMLTKELIQEHPYEGEPRIMMGDIFMRKQEPIMAVLEYKEAIDINPDYLDRQTPRFQGKKMEVAVKEALLLIERNIEKNPEDALMKKHRKNVYYLQRRLAGGCS
jgi:lipopolysaccharide biosynthesis regulator YciM